METGKATAGTLVVLLALALTGASLAWSGLCPSALAALCGTTSVPHSYLSTAIVAMFAPAILCGVIVCVLPIRKSYKRILSIAPLLPPAAMTVWISFP